LKIFSGNLDNPKKVTGTKNMNMFKLYGDKRSGNCYKAAWLLSLLGGAWPAILLARP